MLHTVYDQSQCSTVVSNARYMKESYHLKCVQHCEVTVDLNILHLYMYIAKVNVHKSNECFKPNFYLVVNIFPMYFGFAHMYTVHVRTILDSMIK